MAAKSKFLIISLRPQMIRANKDFIGKPAPPNYVAGLGRGATGFTTRSDIGPARENIPEATPNNDDEYDQNQDPENETGLFNSAPYEQDDEEADQIWKAIDENMDSRRKIRREKREREELQAYREQRPAIKAQFSDQRRQLAKLSEDDWANIPEATNQSGQKRKKLERMEKFSAIPDTLISAYSNSDGIETPLSSSGAVTNFAEIGKARDRVLGIKLDQAEGTLSTNSSVDPKGYLTSLNSVVVKSATEVGDIQKARTLLKSVTITNPKHAPGWIAAARLEEVAGKLAAARVTIRKGCELCPKNEDIWLESARLNTTENAKVILGAAVKSLPQSIKIWQAAAELEKDLQRKKRVFRRALEFIPTSVVLWKAAVSLEEADDAKILLSRAVELIPMSIELWLALARLETYENARIVLNRARAAVPTSHEIWISAAQLEESQNKPVSHVIERAFKNRSMVLGLGREKWIGEAEKSEKDGFPNVTQAIIDCSLSLGLEEDDELHKLDIWISDAESSISRGHIETARAIYAYSLKTVTTDSELWISAAMLERNHGTPASFDSLLRRAVEYCPKTESLWLMAAKEKWVWGNDVDGARTILREAFRFNPRSESIWLAAVKLESSNQEYDRARLLLDRARDEKNGAGTARVWMKSIVFERQLNDYNKASDLANQAVEKFPKFPKLWMVKGQIEWHDLSDPVAARDSFSKGLKHNPKSVPLWLLASQLETQAFSLQIKARAILERARIINPNVPELWLEAVRIETENPQIAKSLLSRAVKDCPKSGILWSEFIIRESRPQRKAKSVDALKNCDNNDPVIVSTIARLFWSERKIDKARSWFERSCKLDPKYGDGWAWWLKFEQEIFALESKKVETNASQSSKSHFSNLDSNSTLSKDNPIKPTSSNTSLQNQSVPNEIDASTGLQNQAETKLFQKIIDSAVLASPSRGEMWIKVAKDPKNAFLPVKEILDLVVASLSLPMPY
ncbi:Pre-mRNA-processing factor 6 [Smittium culicis]|uniref:Pre-mRNA-processing factor 6 n=1 Tax=Smittium culicis TaxID=133412 RepID=A0A1R1Y498_9FUNG|nr:Pre-mRNA-processing factor 6 [Smittium culicis]